MTTNYRREPMSMRTLVTIVLGLIVGFFAGLILSQVIGIVGFVIFERVIGWRLLPVVAATLGGVAALIVDNRRQRQPR